MLRRLLAIAIVALLAPSSVATWRVGGAFEPDTSYDDETWMFQEPPPAGSQRIYLNGFTTSRAGPVAASPNVGALGTRNEAPAYEYHYAIFGVWIDCNSDGYIGAAEHALREYPASLLGSTSVCPPTTGSAWPAGAHNFNGWVSELISIGRVARPTPRVYQDPDVIVWGDYERPDHAPQLGHCPTYPHPRGTYHSTGGLINFAECHIDRRGIEVLRSFNQAMVVVGDPLDLQFRDEHDARSGRIGQQQTFGTEHQSASPVYVWDCDAAPTTVGPAQVTAIDVRQGSGSPTSWTVPAFFNHTHDGVRPLDNCKHTDDRSGGFYQLEADYNAVSPRNKTESDWNFAFAIGARGGPPLGPLSPGGSGAPNDGGIGWTGGSAVPGWYPDNAYGAKLGPNLVRADLQSVQIAPAFWVTFYAHVGETTLDRGFERPTNGGGKYGDWHCGENVTGIHNGWNCDVDVWYTNRDGSPIPGSGFTRAEPGQVYEFRDVDCYDGGNDAGVPLGLPAYGSEPCH